MLTNRFVCLKKEDKLLKNAQLSFAGTQILLCTPRLEPQENSVLQKIYTAKHICKENTVGWIY